MFRIGGVRLFHGLTDGADDPDVGPLREITSLCGLALGSDDVPQGRTHRSGGGEDGLKRRSRPRVVAVLGQLVDGLDDAEKLLHGAKRIDNQGGAGR